MSNEITITVNAPAHHGSLKTATLLKILLEGVLPGVGVELVNNIDGPKDAGLQAKAEDEFREELAETDYATSLAEFFETHDIKVVIDARNHHKHARPEEANLK